MNLGRQLLCSAAWLGLICAAAHAAEVMPPDPAKHFNDYAGVVPAAKADELNAKLEDFERTTSCQVFVAVFQKMQSDSSLEDYTRRIATAWGVGQKGKNNGLCLFVFMQNRSMRIEVGYGLEGAMPDATCKRIIEDEIKPSFKSGDYGAGLGAGVDAILKAVKGEYKVGAAAAAGAPQRESSTSPIPFIVFFVIVVLIIVVAKTARPRGTIFGSGGQSSWGGSSWSGGGSSGGGFSGGGGSFGGGGASGSW